MPTKRPRTYEVPDNLPATLDPESACPVIYTADRLRAKRPEAYAGIAADLGAGLPVTRIMRKWRVHHNSIASIRSRERKVVELHRGFMKGLIGVAAQMTLEKFLERLEGGHIPYGLLPVAVGIMLDKARQADGEPTQTIEIKKSVTLDMVAAELAAMKEVDVTEPPGESSDSRDGGDVG